MTKKIYWTQEEGVDVSFGIGDEFNAPPEKAKIYKTKAKYETAVKKLEKYLGSEKYVKDFQKFLEINPDESL